MNQQQQYQNLIVLLKNYDNQQQKLNEYKEEVRNKNLDIIVLLLDSIRLILVDKSAAPQTKFNTLIFFKDIINIENEDFNFNTEVIIKLLGNCIKDKDNFTLGPQDPEITQNFLGLTFECIMCWAKKYIVDPFGNISFFNSQHQQLKRFVEFPTEYIYLTEDEIVKKPSIQQLEQEQEELKKNPNNLSQNQGLTKGNLDTQQQQQSNSHILDTSQRQQLHDDDKLNLSSSQNLSVDKIKSKYKEVQNSKVQLQHLLQSKIYKDSELNSIFRNFFELKKIYEKFLKDPSIYDWDGIPINKQSKQSVQKQFEQYKQKFEEFVKLELGFITYIVNNIEQLRRKKINSLQFYSTFQKEYTNNKSQTFDKVNLMVIVPKEESNKNLLSNNSAIKNRDKNQSNNTQNNDKQQLQQGNQIKSQQLSNAQLEPPNSKNTNNNDNNNILIQDIPTQQSQNNMVENQVLDNLVQQEQEEQQQLLQKKISQEINEQQQLKKQLEMQEQKQQLGSSNLLNKNSKELHQSGEILNYDHVSVSSIQELKKSQILNQKQKIVQDQIIQDNTQQQQQQQQQSQQQLQQNQQNNQNTDDKQNTQQQKNDDNNNQGNVDDAKQQQEINEQQKIQQMMDDQSQIERNIIESELQQEKIQQQLLIEQAQFNQKSMQFDLISNEQLYNKNKKASISDLEEQKQQLLLLQQQQQQLELEKSQKIQEQQQYQQQLQQQNQQVQQQSEQQNNQEGQCKNAANYFEEEEFYDPQRAAQQIQESQNKNQQNSQEIKSQKSQQNDVKSQKSIQNNNDDNNALDVQQFMKIEVNNTEQQQQQKEQENENQQLQQQQQQQQVQDNQNQQEQKEGDNLFNRDNNKYFQQDEEELYDPQRHQKQIQNQNGVKYPFSQSDQPENPIERVHKIREEEREIKEQILTEGRVGEGDKSISKGDNSSNYDDLGCDEVEVENNEILENKNINLNQNIKQNNNVGQDRNNPQIKNNKDYFSSKTLDFKTSSNYFYNTPIPHNFVHHDNSSCQSTQLQYFQMQTEQSMSNLDKKLQNFDIKKLQNNKTSVYFNSQQENNNNNGIPSFSDRQKIKEQFGTKLQKSSTKVEIKRESQNVLEDSQEIFDLSGKQQINRKNNDSLQIIQEDQYNENTFNTKIQMKEKQQLLEQELKQVQNQIIHLQSEQQYFKQQQLENSAMLSSQQNNSNNKLYNQDDQIKEEVKSQVQKSKEDLRKEQEEGLKQLNAKLKELEDYKQQIQTQQQQQITYLENQIKQKTEEITRQQQLEFDNLNKLNNKNKYDSTNINDIGNNNNKDDILQKQEELRLDLIKKYSHIQNLQQEYWDMHAVIQKQKLNLEEISNKNKTFTEEMTQLFSGQDDEIQKMKKELKSIKKENKNLKQLVVKQQEEFENQKNNILEKESTQKKDVRQKKPIFMSLPRYDKNILDSQNSPSNINNSQNRVSTDQNNSKNNFCSVPNYNVNKNQKQNMIDQIIVQQQQEKQQQLQTPNKQLQQNSNQTGIKIRASPRLEKEEHLIEDNTYINRNNIIEKLQNQSVEEIQKQQQLQKKMQNSKSNNKNNKQEYENNSENDYQQQQQGQEIKFGDQNLQYQQQNRISNNNNNNNINYNQGENIIKINNNTPGFQQYQEQKIMKSVNNNSNMLNANQQFYDQQQQNSSFVSNNNMNNSFQNNNQNQQQKNYMNSNNINNNQNNIHSIHYNSDNIIQNKINQFNQNQNLNNGYQNNNVYNSNNANNRNHRIKYNQYIFGPDSTENYTLKKACLKNQSVLFENDEIQIGITTELKRKHVKSLSNVPENNINNNQDQNQQQYNKSFVENINNINNQNVKIQKTQILVITFYFTNKVSHSTMKNIFLNFEQNHVGVKILQHSVFNANLEFAPFYQYKKKIEIEIYDIPYKLTQFEFSYRFNAIQKTLRLNLPITINKFCQNIYVSPQEFENKWNYSVNLGRRLVESDQFSLDANCLSNFQDILLMFPQFIPMNVNKSGNFIQEDSHIQNVCGCLVLQQQQNIKGQFLVKILLNKQNYKIQIQILDIGEEQKQQSNIKYQQQQQQQHNIYNNNYNEYENNQNGRGSSQQFYSEKIIDFIMENLYFIFEISYSQQQIQKQQVQQQLLQQSQIPKMLPVNQPSPIKFQNKVMNY